MTSLRLETLRTAKPPAAGRELEFQARQWIGRGITSPADACRWLAGALSQANTSLSNEPARADPQPSDAFNDDRVSSAQGERRRTPWYSHFAISCAYLPSRPPCQP
jgi:hypothetical protein